MGYVRPFDPWRGNSLCTCPFKYTVNPYTGCGHRCLYCYASSYIRRFFEPRPKRNFVKIAARDLRRIPEGSIINVSSSSDPYQPLELEYGFTRRLIEMAAGRYLLEIVTKSDAVARDRDLLARGPSIVSITVTTLDRSLSARLEPGAPAPERRLRTIESLSQAGVPVVLRLDPLIPGLNDAREQVREVVEAAAAAGARHVVSSVYKVKPDNLRRVIEAFPEIIPRIRELYMEKGRRVRGCLYADGRYRLKVLKTVMKEARRAGLTFSACREGFPWLSDPGVTCDGTHLVTRHRLIARDEG